MSESEQQNLPSQEQSELKLTRTELTLIKKLPSQIKEIVSQNARIEHQLHTLNKDIKQITQTLPDKIESRESFKQIQTQVAQLETRLIKIGNAFDNVVANMKSKKKKKGKKKDKKSKK
jgi:regulator of replication initiation timing